jgi:hypothetical protein
MAKGKMPTPDDPGTGIVPVENSYMNLNALLIEPGGYSI